jgi:8-oxo-dGTP pyrophosphatase MutT (NUDIX family)
MSSGSSALSSVWRARIRENLNRATAQRIRALFEEINPELVGDGLFEDRWSDIRKDAAVLVPLIERASGPAVVLTVRAPDMPSHAGQISFPGGKTHPEDRSPVETALRETQEEIGVRADEIDVFGTLGVHRGGLGFSVTPVVGVLRPDAVFAPSPREVAEIFEVPLAFIADLRNHLTEERVHKGVPYNMFAAPYGRYHIWGLTAGILRTLAETLQDESRPLGAAAE